MHEEWTGSELTDCGGHGSKRTLERLKILVEKPKTSSYWVHTDVGARYAWISPVFFKTQADSARRKGAQRQKQGS